MAKECIKDGCNNPRFGGGFCKWHQYYRGEKKKRMKRVRVKPISQKMQEKYKKYRPLRDEYMGSNPFCEVNGCTKVAQDLHHKAGRVGENMCDVNTFMAVCRTCHNYIHEHPKEARERGWLI